MFALTASNKRSMNQLNHIELGLAGEAYVASILRLQGFLVSHIAQNQSKSGDIRAVDKFTGEVHLVEVKTAKISKRGRWQFCLNKGLHTQCTYSDIIVFLIIDKNEKIFMYACPSSFFRGTQNFTMSSHPTVYRGKLASFIQRNERLDFSDMHATASLQIGRLQ